MEILDFGSYFQVWDYEGSILFESESIDECEDYIADYGSVDE